MRVIASVLLLFRSIAADNVHGALDLGKLMYSNLHGRGPTRDVEESLRFQKVLSTDGTDVDVLITSKEYTPYAVNQNGPLHRGDKNSPGIISMKAGTKARFQVEFVKSGTKSSHVAVPEFLFSVFDLEKPSDSQEDVLEVNGFSAVYLPKNTVLMYRYGKDGTSFKPSDEAVGHESKDPQNCLLLSQEQRAHTATFLFQDTESFEFSVDLADVPHAQQGRQLLFGSAANAPSYATHLPASYLSGTEGEWRRADDWLEDLSREEDDADSEVSSEVLDFQEPGPLETTCSCNLDLTHVEVNNLGGLGPDKGVGSMLRYKDVCIVDGHKVDLVIEDLSGYSSTSVEKNGRSSCGPYGSISVQLGSMVALKARFLDPETNVEVTMKDFFLTIFDMDLHGAHSELVTIHGFDDFFVSKHSMLSHEEVMNGGLFRSPGDPVNVQCPHDPMALSHDQASVGVTALFREAESFKFTLEALGPESDRSHTFFFGGTSSLNSDCVGDGLPTSTITKTSTTSTTETKTATTTTNTSTTHTTTTRTESTSTVTTTFNCSSFQASSSPWPDDAQTFCCGLDKQYCTSTSTTATHTTVTTKTTTETTFTTEPFNCRSGSADQWSHNKSKFCCEEHHKGCPATTTTKPEPFDCDDLKPSQWSTEKQAYCCDKHKLGCSLLDGNSSRHRHSSSTSTAAPYTGCGTAVTCEMKLNSVTHDNLGGMGPDRIEPPVIRYGEVCFADGEPVDLVIAADGPYKPFNSFDDGKSAWGPYGAINVKMGTSVKLKASFMKGKTDTPVKIESVYFSLVGLSQLREGHREVVTVETFGSVDLSDDSYVQQGKAGDSASFQSTAKGNVQVAGDPLQCGQMQEKTTVSLLFKDVSTFSFMLSVEGRETEDGRDFLFGGRSCITEHCGAPPKKVATTTSTAAKYDCYNGIQASWSTQQRQWCCTHRAIACGKPYDCSAGYESWRFGWSQMKMDYCCRHEHRGCRFNCDVAYNNWKAAWSDKKKEWCCNSEQRGCKNSERYDCGLERSKWSSAMQHWCCKNEHKGCEDPSQAAWSPFNCEKDLGSWRRTWSHPKKQWCCDNFAKGCEGTTPEPFDCTRDFEHWQQAWEPPKKEWCCHNYNRGCADVLRRFEKLPGKVWQGLGWSRVALLSLGGAAALLLLLLTGRQGRRLVLRLSGRRWRLAYVQLAGNTSLADILSG